MFLDKIVNFKDFSRPNKAIMYLSRTLTEFKDFSRQLLKLKTFSRLYEPCYYIVIVVCSNFQTNNMLLTMTVSLSTPSSSSRVRVGRLSSGSALAEALTDCSDSLLS